MSYNKNKINMEDILKLIRTKSIRINDISTDDGDLEDVFLQLTKN